MKLYGLKNCDNCKKALQEIRKAGKDIEFIDLRAHPISQDMIKNWLDQHGDGVLVNRKSTTWRNLSERDRRTPAPILLQTYSNLIKRPIIIAGDQSFVGWNLDVKSALGVV